jgi:hypothetical protein
MVIRYFGGIFFPDEETDDNNDNKKKEGFEQSNPFVLKQNEQVFVYKNKFLYKTSCTRHKTHGTRPNLMCLELRIRNIQSTTKYIMTPVLVILSRILQNTHTL